MPLQGDNDPVWDCHVHVFGDPIRYPYTNNRRYTPSVATLEDLEQHLASIGAGCVVLVQPTTYGEDNSCLLDALRDLGERARGIAVLDPATVTDATLQDLHVAGIRGIRINPPGRVRSVEQVAEPLAAWVSRLKASGWQIEANCATIAAEGLSEIVASSDVPLVLDHLAGIQPRHAAFGEHREMLYALACNAPIWIKLSGCDRVCETEDDRRRWAETALALSELMPERLVWGSDWPHTPVKQSIGGARKFRAVDSKAQLDWLGGVIGKVRLTGALTGNAARLFG